MRSFRSTAIITSFNCFGVIPEQPGITDRQNQEPSDTQHGKRTRKSISLRESCTCLVRLTSSYHINLSKFLLMGSRTTLESAPNDRAYTIRTFLTDDDRPVPGVIAPLSIPESMIRMRNMLSECVPVTEKRP